ncbi:MAG: glycoside hydrolase family 127 protein [Bacteroidales bacterium]|nr:glycoside hydrolase family 127 protein [Bacteroidales bacterium]
MKTIIPLVAILIFAGCTNSGHNLSDYPITPVSLNSIKLTDNFWLPKIKTIREITIPYAFEKCRIEGRMDNFLIAGGKMDGETKGAMPFDDTDLYKIIEGASYSLILMPDKNLEAYLDSIIAIIKTGQEKDGYLTTWKTINPDEPPAPWVKPGGRWQNLDASHELYNSGHLFEAAAAHYYATGKRNFLDIALKNADLLTETFGPGKNPQLPGHQIVETGLIKLYQITHKTKYLELARHFLDSRGNPQLRKLYGPYNQDHQLVIDQDEVVGHAVRALYMYAGMTDIAAIYRDTAYLKAVNVLWENMVNKKMYITGGVGARHEGESFGENYELPNLTAYSETCAAIGSVYWNHRMFLQTGQVKYYDIIERTLYNALISGISLEGDKFFYPNPLEADGEYAFNKGACTRQSWFDCSCCPTNLIRFLPSVPNLIYATDKDNLYINLFMSNEASISLDGNKIKLSQETEYPWSGKILFLVNPEKQNEFTIKIRVPGWARNNALPGNLYSYANPGTEKIRLKINGQAEDTFTNEEYITITRLWEKGDTIELNFPMQIQKLIADEKIESDRNLVALEYGPIVYCAEEIDNPYDFTKLAVPGIKNLKVIKRNDLLNGVNIITGNVDTLSDNNKSTLTLVPYYAWSNRGIGKMRVWMPETSN